MSAPKKKRTLTEGCSGKDAQGVQRALYVAVRELGKPPQNGRTGNYGSGSIADAKTFQHSVGIEASGNIGQPTLDALWPWFDAYGRSLYFRACIGEATELPNGKLAYGAKGDRVRAAQQMMWRGLGESSQNARNGIYGDGLAADVRHYLGIIDAAPGDGRQISQSVWEMLWGFGDQYSHELALEAGGGSSAASRSELVTWAEWYVAQRGSLYAQIRPYQRDDPPELDLLNDCSGSSSHLLKLAGFPDPSGNDYNGVGYTGTMMHGGTRHELPSSGAAGLLAGDLVFYGGSSWSPSHVAMMLDAGRLFTFGGNPPTITTYAGYWSSGRRYEIGARRMIP